MSPRATSILRAAALALGVVLTAPTHAGAAKSVSPMAASPEILVEEWVLGQGLIDAPPDASVLVEFNSEGPAEAVAIDGFNIDERSGRFAVRFELEDGSMVVQRGNVQAILPAFLPVRRIAAGEIIGEADLRRSDLPARSVATHVLTSQRDIVGKETRRALMPNRPISASSLIEPRIVLRGDEVRISYENGSLDLSAPGKSLEDGALGERIRVVNLHSSKSITAEVVGGGLVAVRPMTITTTDD